MHPTVLSQLSKLHRAVLRQLGGGADAQKSALDAAEHGADGGFHGFIYFTETVKFFERNRKEILARLKENADDQGVTVGDVLGQSWRGLVGVSEPLFVLAIGSSHEDYQTVANALAWFALEDCGHVLQNEQEMQEG